MKRLLIVTLLLAGCVDFRENTTGSFPRNDVRVFVGLELTQRADAPDTLAVHGLVAANAAQVRFVDDTLRVNGQAVPPTPGRAEVARFYNAVVRLASEGPGSAVEVKLPVVQEVDFVPATFRAPLWIRQGPAKLAVAKGADLVFPVASAPAPAELSSGGSGLWRLEIRRGGSFLNVQSSGAVPGRIVIPGASVPDDTARFISAELSVSHSLRTTSRSDSARVQYRGHSRIMWSVEVVP